MAKGENCNREIDLHNQAPVSLHRGLNDNEHYSWLIATAIHNNLFCSSNIGKYWAANHVIS